MKRRLCLLALVLTLVMSFTAFAGDWYQKDGEWYYTDTSNPWVRYGDDWYYIDSTGKMMTNYITPDGYYISFSGRMVNQSDRLHHEKNSVEFRKTNLVLKYLETGDSSVLQTFNTGNYGTGYYSACVGLLDGRILFNELQQGTVYGYNQKELYNYVKSVLEPIAKESVSLPELERAQFLYDKVCETLEYGYPYEETIKQAESEGKNLMGLVYSRTIPGALLTKSGFCVEYTEVYNRLCNLAGLDAYTETCMEHDHTWTVLVINGERYYADTSSWDQIGARDRRVVKNRYWCSHDLYSE
ncbi:MAG: hypothetical protein Q4E24_16080 [bacterium]|nr:hypothetical protein [bacterium]